MKKTQETMTRAGVQKTYRLYAPIYDFLFGAVLEPGRKSLCDEVVKLNPKRLLEVGVGTGLLINRYPELSDITGIDVSEEMLNIAATRAKLNPEKSISLLEMDAENMTFGNNSFDCVVAPYVLSVTPNPEKLLREMQRVCKNDGTIIILNHFSGSGTWYLLEKLVKNAAQKIGFRSDFSYEQHIGRHQLSISKLETVNMFGLSKLVVFTNTKK